MSVYTRPIVSIDPARPPGALPLGGGWAWFRDIEVLERGRAPQIMPAAELSGPELSRLTCPRAAVAGLSCSEPRVMGILNVTPDSFSDGGQFEAVPNAVAAAQGMAKDGAHILDIGGESTRPGADFVPPEEETRRTAPVIEALRAAGVTQTISIDTRKSEVAEAALAEGADLINDVSGFTFDPALADVAKASGVPVCVMHAQGDPATMQDNPSYDNVLLDVYDFLEQRLDMLEARGLPRSQIVVDPGIGFGKTLAHNLALLQRISLFHALGAPVLLGASRKRFIGTIGLEPRADQRAPGSIAVALAAVAQGVQIVRVHDVAETMQALRLWTATRAGDAPDV